jgi:lysophospholipase L1-like esterase
MSYGMYETLNVYHGSHRTTSSLSVIRYFGTSITAGSGATHALNCWVSRNMLWLPTAHSAIYAKGVNVGIGGDDSWKMLLRLQTDVIAYSPDVVTLDAINDVDSAHSKSCAEALIRLIRTALPNARLIYLAFMRVTDPAVDDPTNVRAAINANWEDLCTLYSIPFVDYAAYVAEQVNGGFHHLQEYFPGTDKIHPSDYGHACIEALLEPYLTSDFLLVGPQVTGDLPARIYDNGDYENTPISALGTSGTVVSGTWTDSGTARVSSTADSEISFTGTFQSFGVGALPAGVIQWKLDDGAYSANVSFVSGYPVTLLGTTTRGEHTVTIKVISGTFTLSTFYAI